MCLKVNNLCGIIFLIFRFITFVIGDCKVIFTPITSMKPYLILKLGSHQMKVTPKNNYILKEEEEIEVLCDTYFESPLNFFTKDRLFMKCTDNSIYARDVNSYYNLDYYSRNHYDNKLFQCSSLKWNLYESLYNFVWCPANVTSYILAKPKYTSILQHQYEYLAGICYDTYSQTFHSLYYTVSPKSSEHLRPTALTDFYTPVLKINFTQEIFDRKSTTQDINDYFGLHAAIKDSQYDFRSILQVPKLNFDYYNFDALLEFISWSNLRLGNWKRYEAALMRHIKSQKQSYDILAGISGAVEAPFFEDCQTNYTMEEMIYNSNRKIPMYVWNHLQATGNSNNEIVVIGFNSPFYEFYLEKEVIFCPDICHKIDWLNEISTTFRYSAMGVIFCCNVEDVKFSKRLNGFQENPTNDLIKSENNEKSMESEQDLEQTEEEEKEEGEY